MTKANIEYMHYRKYDRRGQIMATGGMTLAIERNGNQLTVAMAKCSKKDNFDRRLGRLIAEGRLRSGSHVHVIEMPNDVMVKSFVDNQDFVRHEIERLLAGGR